MNLALAAFGSTALLLLPALGLRSARFQPEAQKPSPREDRAAKWIEDLGNADHEERERAYDELLDAGASVLPALEKAARESKDPEVRWNARMLARQIRSSERAEEGSGRLAPRGREIPDRWFPPVGKGWDAFDPDGFLAEMRRMRERFAEMEKEFGNRLEQEGAETRGSSVRVEQREGHVRVEVTERKDEKTETKVYEAESWEDFRAKHPEIVEQYGLDLGREGFTFRVGPERGPFTLRGPERLWAPFPPLGLPGEKVSGERLGVFVEPVSPDLAEDLGLEAGAGLRVVEVEKGSLAAAMGVKERDVLVKIGGAEIGGPETIREVLGKTEEGKTVTVEVQRRGEGTITLSAVKKAPPPKPLRKAEKPVKEL